MDHEKDGQLNSRFERCIFTIFISWGLKLIFLLGQNELFQGNDNVRSVMDELKKIETEQSLVNCFVRGLPAL